MFVKQVDKRTALELAAKGEEILLMEPDTVKPENWMDCKGTAVRLGV